MARLQKTYIVDFLFKKQVKNNGIVPQYYVENSYEPTIPCDILYADAGRNDTACKSPQRSETEEKGLQQQVCFIKYYLLF